MEPLPFFLFLVLVLFAALAARRAVRLRRLVRVLGALDVVPIAQAQGLSLVRARAQSLEPLTSPFQRRPCIHYFFRVEEPRDSGAGGSLKPRRLATGKEWSELWIEDESGRARVQSRAAMVASPHEHRHEYEDLREIPVDRAEFFDRAGIALKHLPRFQRLRVVETTIEPGDEVFVTGTVRLEDGEKVFYRAPPSPLIVSAERNVGIVKGLRHELALFSVVPILLLAFAALFLAIALT